MAITVGVDTEDRLHAVETRSRLHLSLCGQLPHRLVYGWAWSDHVDDTSKRCELCARRAAELAVAE